MKKRTKRVLALMVCGMMAAGFTAQATGEGSIAERFEQPDAQSKGMFRYWIPYAVENYDELKKQMTDMYESGFGGVEVAFFPSGYAYDNTVYGWATENWRTTMKNILKIASEYEDGFIVDFTISPGWPLALNTIDPNDAEADTELVSAYAKLTATGSAVEMPMAAIATTDTFSTPFIIRNNLVAAVVGQVMAVGEDGALTLDPATLKTVATAQTDKTTPAGIPAVDGLDTESEEYKYILSLYGGEAPDTSAFFTDSAGKPVDVRKALEDTQNYYTADLTDAVPADYAASEGDAIVAGDYVLYGFYQRGTGGTTLIMGKYGIMEDALPGVPYETSPISAAASQTVIDFMNKNLFCDEELLELMHTAHAEIGGAIFEDSLENKYSDGVAWTDELADTFSAETGYTIEASLPLLSGAAASDGSEAKLYEDYNTVVSHMYQNNHVAILQDYFNEKTGFNYRAQAYLTNPAFELDLSATSAQVDIAEGESLAFGVNYDSFRLVSGGVHIADKTLVSDEAFALQEGTVYNMPWSVVLNTMNSNFASGVNRLIFHGASYSGSDGATSEVTPMTAGWPGWHAFDMVCTDAWDARMPYWEDIDKLSGYIARNQAVLQNGRANMDLLVYDLNSYDYSTRNRAGDNSAFGEILDAGFTYDTVMTDGLLLEQNTVTDGVLCADGPSYQAVLVNNLDAAEARALTQLKAFAEAGLKVIFVGALPQTASCNESSDADIAELTQALLANENVAHVETHADVLAALESFGIAPHAAYAQTGLRGIMREDTDGSRYYFLYNENDEPIVTDLHLSGSGAPCTLNAWSGEIAALAGYNVDETGINTTLVLDSHATTIIALRTDGEALANSITTAGLDTFNRDGEAAARIHESGTVEITRADGSSTSNEISVPEAVALDDWSLSIESWGPETDTDAQGDTRKTMIEIGQTPLVIWDALKATDEQLSEAGVASMENVSGIGHYETEITLDALDGAVLVLEHGTDMITSITVNGQEIEGINPAATRFDIGSALKEGSNTIQVKLATTLLNRVCVENGMFEGFERGAYGITSATIEPYCIVK